MESGSPPPLVFAASCLMAISDVVIAACTPADSAAAAAAAAAASSAGIVLHSKGATPAPRARAGAPGATTGTTSPMLACCARVHMSCSCPVHFPARRVAAVVPWRSSLKFQRAVCAPCLLTTTARLFNARRLYRETVRPRGGPPRAAVRPDACLLSAAACAAGWRRRPRVGVSGHAAVRHGAGVSSTGIPGRRRHRDSSGPLP